VRAVFLTHNYPRDPGDLPGAFLHPLAVALRRRDVDVRVVAPSDRGRGGHDELDGVPVTRVRYARPEREDLAYSGALADGLNSPGGLLALAGLWRALRRGARAELAADTLVHAHWWLPAGLAAPPECPLLVTLHGTDGALLQRSAVARTLGRTVFRRARRITAVSTSLARIVQRTLPGTDVAVQPMPVETGEWGWSAGGLGALLVARLTEQKRVTLALEALARIRAKGSGLKLTIVGDGPVRPAIEARVHELDLDESVSLRGSLPFAQVRNLLLDADVALQLGRNEGFGLAAAEALMTGVPVIVCDDGGGLLDLVHGGDDGAVVAPTPGALAEAMARIAGDSTARPRARAAGSRWRRGLTPDTVAAAFEGWYREALDHAG